MNTKIWSCMAVALLALQGCDGALPVGANAVLTDQMIADRTAAFFGSTEAHVQVFGFQRGVETTAYQARFDGQTYDCSMHMQQVRCALAAP